MIYIVILHNLIISIHALLAESDQCRRPRPRPLFISIHALLAESDNCPRVMVSPTLYFYPRSPCGERLTLQDIKNFSALFLSTLSLRRATMTHTQRFCASTFLSTLSLRRATVRGISSGRAETISIHALLAESDVLLF